MIDTGLGTSASSELAFRMAPGQARPTPTISPEIPLRASWRRGRNRGSATRRAQEGPKPPAKRKASKKHGFEKQIRKASTDEDPPIWDRKNQPAPRSSLCFETNKLQKKTQKQNMHSVEVKRPSATDHRRYKETISLTICIL